MWARGIALCTLALNSLSLSHWRGVRLCFCVRSAWLRKPGRAANILWVAVPVPRGTRLLTGGAIRCKFGWSLLDVIIYCATMVRASMALRLHAASPHIALIRFAAHYATYIAHFEPASLRHTTRSTVCHAVAHLLLSEHRISRIWLHL